MARTDSGATVSVFVTTNDFDPDGDPFGVVEVATPAHGSVDNGGNFFNYTPDPGFSGIETITYRLRDTHGLLSLGTARVWVDSGVAGAESPVADDDYAVVYQDATVGFTTGDLIANDDDPQGQALSVVAVSEPSNDGVLTGSLATGFTYTPSNDPALIDSDHQINYLVTDTDGHVTQGRLIIRILATGDPNQPPVARDDVARTDSGATVACSSPPTTSIPTAIRSAWSRSPPPPTAASTTAATSSTTHPTPASPESRPSPTDSATPTDCCRWARRGCGSIRVLRDAESPVADDDYAVVYQDATVGFTTGDLIANDDDPQGQVLSVVAVSEPSTDGVLTGSLATGFTYTPSNNPALINSDHQINYLVTDTDGHVAQGHLIIRILATGDPNQPPVAVPDVGSTVDSTVSVFVTANDFDPDGDPFSVVEVATPPTAPSTTAATRQLHTRPRLLRNRNHHLPTPRHPRAAGERTGRRLGQHIRRPSSDRVVDELQGAGRRHPADHPFGRRPGRQSPGVEPRHATRRQLGRVLSGAAPTLTYTAPTNRATTSSCTR